MRLCSPAGEATGSQGRPTVATTHPRPGPDETLDRQTAGAGRFWRGLTEGHEPDVVAPHLEVGPAAPAMGIDIWSAGKPV